MTTELPSTDPSPHPRPSARRRLPIPGPPRGVRLRFWQSALILAFLWAAIYMAGLGAPELKGEEGRRILPAIHMVESGDWVVPIMEGQPFLRKPPGINWAIATSMLLLERRDELAARLPSALSVLALAYAGLLAGRGLLGGSAGGLILGVILLTSAGCIEKGRLAEIEALYVSLTGIAILAWAGLWRVEASKWFTWTIPFLFLGAGWLVKGPPHLIFFYGLVVAALWKDRSLRELWHPAHFAGWGIMAALFGPWAWLCRQRLAGLLPEVKTENEWIAQLTSRLNGDEFQFTSWLAAPWQSLIMLLPWGLILVFFWRRLPAVAEKLGGRDKPLINGFRFGLLVTFLVIILLPESRSRFVLPLLAPAALLSAVLVVHDLPAAWQKRWQAAALGLMGLLSLAGAVAPWLLPGVAAPFAATASLVCAFAIWRVWLKLNSLAQPLLFVITSGLAFALFGAINAAVINPATRTRDNSRPVGRAISDAVPPGALLAILNPGSATSPPTPLHWRFYLRCEHVVFPRLSQLPENTGALLVKASARAEEKTARKLEQMGFMKELLSLKDEHGTAFVLLTRENGAEEAVGRPTVRPARK